MVIPIALVGNERMSTASTVKRLIQIKIRTITFMTFTSSHHHLRGFGDWGLGGIGLSESTPWSCPKSLPAPAPMTLV